MFASGDTYGFGYGKIPSFVHTQSFNVGCQAPNSISPAFRTTSIAPLLCWYHITFSKKGSDQTTCTSIVHTCVVCVYSTTSAGHWPHSIKGSTTAPKVCSHELLCLRAISGFLSGIHEVRYHPLCRFDHSFKLSSPPAL